MTQLRKDLIKTLLKGIETGDPASVAVVNEAKYIQHNPQTHEGSEGLATLFARLAKTNPRVNIVRIFSDGDFVFGHTEYDFSTRRVGFEVFRFEGDQAVEHWDNIQPRPTVEENPSGNSMIDGPTEATDLNLTEDNRLLVQNFVQQIFVEGSHDQIGVYLPTNDQDFVQHSPRLGDGSTALMASLQATNKEGQRLIRYDTIHRVLAEGNFVLVVSEGYLDQVHTSFYDLYRVENGLIVEHWETIEAVPPKSEWKNNNGKF